MSTFVLIPGAWLGAWAWDEVAEVLQRRERKSFRSACPAWVKGKTKRQPEPTWRLMSAMSSPRSLTPTFTT